MLKKLMVLVAGACVSMTASAGYVQYDLTSSTSPGTAVIGYFIQRDYDQSIAFFDLRVNDQNQNRGASFYPRNDDGGVGYNSPPTTYFRNNGPTNFSLVSNYGSDQISHFSIDFSRGNGGDFNYVANWDYRQNLGPFWEFPEPKYSGTVTGVVTKGTVLPQMAEQLDLFYSGHFYLGLGIAQVAPTYIGPAHVPEPASLALFAVGIVGALGASRRRKTFC